MSVQPFTPKGPVSERAALVEAMQDAPYETLFTFEDLSDVIGRDIRTNRGCLYEAQKTLEKTSQRTLVSVPTVGYKIASPDQHEALAVKHQKRGRRQLTKALSRVTSTNRSALTSQEQQRLTDLETNLRAQQTMLRQTNAKVAKIEHKQVEQDGQVAILTAAMKKAGLL